jgi:hypothetical protein
METIMEEVAVDEVVEALLQRTTVQTAISAQAIMMEPVV